MRELSPTARSWYVGIWAFALLLAVVSYLVFPLPQFTLSSLLAALLFAVALTIADLAAFTMSDGRMVSIAVALLIAGLTALGWPLLLLVIAVGTVSAALARQKPWLPSATTVAVRWIGFIAATAILALATAIDTWRGIEPTMPYTTLATLLGLLLIGVTVYLVERSAETLLAAATAGPPADAPQTPATIRQRAALFVQHLRQQWTGRLDDFQWHALMLAPIGGLLAVLWAINLWGAFVLGLVPIIIVHRALWNQAQLRARNDEVQQRDAENSALNDKLERLQQLATAMMGSLDVTTVLTTLCRRLADLFDASSSWVVLLDKDQQPAVVAWHNLPVEPPIDGDLVVPWPQSYEAVFERQRVAVLTDQRAQTLAPLRALSDARYWDTLIVIPLIADNRTLGALCLTFAEIHGLQTDERRILTAFARQAAMVLEHVRLFREVQESQARLVQASKMEALAIFAAGTAHEFNNLLAGILGHAQLGIASEELHEKNDSLKVVIDTCKRGRSITGGLLTFARRQEPRHELGDIREVVDSTLTLMEIELRKHNIQVERQIMPVRPTVCDLGQISQVFLNLLTNARDAMKPDGGILTVMLDSDDEWINIAVSDTGVGIPEQIRAKIFEPFVTTKGALGGSHTPGTGLGLSICHGIVKEHGGVIDVASVVGAGTTMTVRLPVIYDSEPAGAVAPLNANGEVPHLVILVVDDDPAIGGSLRGLLERAGHTVSVANSAATALQLYREQRFDLVLTDMAMPGMSGVQLVQSLRTLDPQALILVFTGQALNQQVAQALNLGAAGVVPKPFEFVEVTNAISHAWNRRNGMQVSQDSE